MWNKCNSMIPLLAKTSVVIKKCINVFDFSEHRTVNCYKSIVYFKDLNIRTKYFRINKLQNTNFYYLQTNIHNISQTCLFTVVHKMLSSYFIRSYYETSYSWTYLRT